MTFLGKLVSILFLVAALTFAGTYAVPYFFPCRRPLAYDIGQFDSGFGITREAFLQSLVNAEAPWEQAFNRELFVYKPGASFKVNLIYDYRQQESNKNKELSEAIGNDLTTYKQLEDRYNTLSRDYKARLQAYNQQVASWNERGGAPEAEYAKLEKERIALNGLVQQINTLANRLNSLSESANQKVDTYNQDAGKVFDKGEFVQNGLRKTISIYEFQTITELTLTLTHELGHALGADHVENETSVLYPVLQKQPLTPIQLTTEDRAELARVCRL